MTSSRARKKSTRAHRRTGHRGRSPDTASPADPLAELSISIAAAQTIILPNDDDISPLERQLWQWLTVSTTAELDGLTRWLTRAAPAWTQLAVHTSERPAALHRLTRLTHDATATRTARAANDNIRDTWHRLMTEQPTLRPADALTAARGIHT